MKKFRLFTTFVATAVAAASFMVGGCAKDTNQVNKKGVPEAEEATTEYKIHLDKKDIDKLGREIGIAHNNLLFAMYNNSDIEGMNAKDLCFYVHDYLTANIDEMGFELLPDYFHQVNILGDGVAEMYSNIGTLIEGNGSEMILPEDADLEYIKNSMNEYYDFIYNTLLESNSYDEFENACMMRLKEMCDGTQSLNEYFYMCACGNVTFASFCAWASIYSGGTDAKGLCNWIKEKYQAVKEFVKEKIVDPIHDIVNADLCGGAIGCATGLAIGAGVAFGTGQVYAPVVGIVAGGVVGAATGSIYRALN